jgi:ATP-dependent Lon protease
MDNQNNSNNALIPLNDMLPNSVLIIPIFEKPAFPGMMIPITIVKEDLIKIITEYMTEKNDYVGIVYYSGDYENEITPDLFPQIGTIGKIIRKMNLPEGGINYFSQYI